jgi:hypothetical protein
MDGHTFCDPEQGDIDPKCPKSTRPYFGVSIYFKIIYVCVSASELTGLPFLKFTKDNISINMIFLSHFLEI